MLNKTSDLYHLCVRKQDKPYRATAAVIPFQGLHVTVGRATFAPILSVF